MRDEQFFLSLAHLESIAGLLSGLVSMLLRLREQGGPRGGRELEEPWSAEQSARTQHPAVKFIDHMGQLVRPQTAATAAPKVRDRGSP